MKLTNKHELMSAGLIMLLGIGTMVKGMEYSIGTLARMGPGFFPVALGALLTILGGLIIVTPLSEDDIEAEMRPPRADTRSWIIVVVGVIAFMVIGKYGGLVPATFTLIFLTALGDRQTGLKAAFFLATGVTVFAVAVFHYAMQMQFPLFTWG